MAVLMDTITHTSAGHQAHLHTAVMLDVLLKTVSAGSDCAATAKDDGIALLTTLVLEEGTTAATAHFPHGLWLSLGTIMHFRQCASLACAGSIRMMGDALLISPVLDGGATAVTAYFPKGLWFSLYDYSAVDASAGGVYAPVAVRAC